MAGNDIVILDNSASRFHAKLEYTPENDSIILHDLDSTNGTFLNRIRILEPRPLKNLDVIRIGLHSLEISQIEDQTMSGAPFVPRHTHQLTRELVLEAIDQHGVLLADVAAKLNTIFDVEVALKTVANMMRVAMGADRCEVILKEKFNQLSELGLADTYAQQAIQQRSAVLVHDAGSEDIAPSRSASLLRIFTAMCVPIISGDEILGLIYVLKNRIHSHPFSQRDLQLAVAIANQAALTINRMQLLERVQQQEVVSRLLHRLLSPQEADRLLDEFMHSGHLPPLEEHNLTIIVSDICDSTELAERLGSRRFSQLLARYYQEMTGIIFDHHGLLNKYLGDGLMLVFGMPHQPPNPEERATQTALDMLDKLDELNQVLGEEIKIGVGINTGSAMAGYIGTQEYIEFSTIGYPVNIAFGLESLARPNRIFIGHPTYQAIIGKFRLQPLGKLEVKKQAEPVQAYEVLR